MTNWKDEIDKQLGIEQKFTSELERKILNKASKKKFEWRYYLIFATFLTALLLFVIIGPKPAEQQPITSSTPFDTLIEQEQVKSFYMSSKWSMMDTFYARDSKYYLFVHKFSKEQKIEEMDALLHKMKLVEMEDPIVFAYDVIVEMTNGEQLSLKIFHNHSWYGVQDVQSKLFYSLEGQSAVAVTSWIKAIENDSFIFFFIIGLLGILILQKYLTKRFAIEDKKTKLTIVISIFVIVLTYFSTSQVFQYINNNEIIMHKLMPISVLFLLFAISCIVNFMFGKRDSKKVKREVILSSLGFVYLSILFWIM